MKGLVGRDRELDEARSDVVIGAPGAAAAAGTAPHARLVGLSEGTDHTRPHVIMLGGP